MGLLLQAGGRLPARLGRHADSGGGLLHQLHARGDLGEGVPRPLRDGFDPAYLRLAGGHGGGDVLHLLANQARGARHLLVRACRFIGQLADFFGYDGEAAAVLAGTCRLDRSVQGEQVRLRRDALDEIDEVVDRGGELGELRDLPGAGLDHLAHVEQHAAGGGHVAAVPFGHAADFLPELAGALRRVRHVPRRLAQLVESRAHGAERGPLLLRPARDLDHRARHLARGRGQLFAHGGQIAGRAGDPVRLGDHLAHDPAQPVSHVLHRVGEHAEFAGHVTGRDGPQVARPEPLRGRHEPRERALHRLKGVARQEHAGDHEGDDERPQLPLALDRVRRQAFGGSRRLLGLAPRQITHQPRQLRRLGSCRGGPRHRLRVAPQVFQRVGDRVFGLDRGMELLQAVDREAVFGGEAAQRVQPALVLKRSVGGRLKQPSRIGTRRREVLLGRADLLEHARDETASHVHGRPEPGQLVRHGVAHVAERRRPGDRRDHQAQHEQHQPHENPVPDRGEGTSHHRSAWVTSAPSCTTPMTTDFPRTSPLASNAIGPVTPSNCSRPRPTRAR